MQLPGPVRAVVGLLASAAEEAKHLPDRAIELPMLAVSSALQMSLRAQQRYARLAARGDDVINRRPPTDDPPPWATFDDPVSLDDLGAAMRGDSDPARRARAASDLLEELLSMDGPPPPTPITKTPAKGANAPAKAPAKKAPANKPPAKKAPATTAAAKKPAAKKPAAKKPAAKKPAAKKAAAAKSASKAAVPLKKPAAAQRRGKSISRPRHAEPSAFDTIGDD